jgi:hypothetical protein
LSQDAGGHAAASRRIGTMRATFAVATSLSPSFAVSFGVSFAGRPLRLTRA